MAKTFAPKRRLPELVNLRDESAPRVEDFAAGRNILLLHGFGSHCNNLRALAKLFRDWGYEVFGFNYRSADSIGHSSAALGQLLDMLVPVSTYGDTARLHAIGHSMGGLVLRAFAQQSDATKYIRSVTMLGSPNEGALSSGLVKRLMQHVEYVSYVLDPDFSAIARGAAARELVRADDENGRECFLDGLNRRDVGRSLHCPYLSVAAGGGPQIGLRISKRSLRQRLINSQIQRILNDPRNDGLVSERSVDLRLFLANAPTPYSHFNDAQYVDFTHLDHSGLIESQVVATLVRRFIEAA